MVGMVGADEAGNRLRSTLTVAGVDIGSLAVSNEVPTGMAVITVDAAGENMIVVDPAANGAFSPDRYHDASEVVAAADLVLFQLEIPIATVAAAVRDATGTVVVNPAPAADLPRDLLERVDVLVPNATELARLGAGEVPQTPAEAIQAARALDGPSAVVVTLGAMGAVVVTDGEGIHVPAPTIVPVDPTAAGDAFCGGLADALVRGKDLVAAVAWAVRCGAVAATRWGAQSSLPTTEEVLGLEAAQ